MYPSALFPDWHSYLYNGIPGIALGEEEDDLLPPAWQDIRLCFNCGSPHHAVASCPEPIDRQLVSLSRQLFSFLHPDLPGQEITRFHVVEEWKQLRLEWLRSFEPGSVRGPLLRDALGLQDGDPGNTVEWLRNMAHWGYPPGWTGFQDPKQLVCSRILEGGGAEKHAATTQPFTIFGAADDDEKIDLGGLFSPRGVPTPPLESTLSVDVETTRWATYPNTYFSSQALSLYKNMMLDRVLPSRVSVTFTPERMALWVRILSGGSSTDNAQSVPPWRFPGAFQGDVEYYVPRPPSATPPPLPASPNPSLHSFTPQECSVQRRESTPSFETIDANDAASVVDMDMSDDNE